MDRGARELLSRRQTAFPAVAPPFLERLQAAFDAKGLGFFGDLAYLADPAAFAAHLAAARRADWIVHAKKPFGGPAQVLAYLGRYTIASPSPTAASKPATTTMSPLTGRTIATAAPSRP